MARLKTSERKGLPDSAFAYIDAKGRRRLPINDEAHVRNALPRFERVAFEDDAARDRARNRLLKAAKRYGIVPVGFITGQIRSETRIWPPCPAEQIRATVCTDSPTYPVSVKVGRPPWTPARTRTSTPSGHVCTPSIRWIASAASNASEARSKLAKYSSAWASTS